jgi:uncharacterized RDD family membrane protein YckC
MDESYKIIGADGREYGPVTLPELRAWVGDGRIARQTLIGQVGGDRWQPAGELEELSDLLGTMPELAGKEDSSELRAAGFWIRFAAHWPDQFIVSAAVISYVGMPDVPPGPPKFEDIMAWTQMAQPWMLLFSAIYYILTTWVWGATLGKLIFGLRVVRLDDSPVGLKESVFRFLASVLSGMIFGIGYLFVAFRPDKRAMHDLLARTRVVHKGD